MRLLLDESIPRHLKNKLVPEILETLDTIQTGQIVRLSAIP